MSFARIVMNTIPITSNNLISNNITLNKITSNKITSNKITSNKITSNKITSNKITSNKITSNNITYKMDRASYTIVGGYKQDRIRKYSSLITILLLNREGKFHRDELLHEFHELDFVEILCIEDPHLSSDIELKIKKFPKVRFLLLRNRLSIGEKINLGIEEARSRNVLVIWDDMKISSSVLSEKIIQEIEEANNICAVPLMKTGKLELIPSLHVPIYIKRMLKVISWNTVNNGMMSLFPFDFCGIYNKEKFILNEGYDKNISNPYWQKMDFGFRAFMWGEKIVCNTSFSISYTDDAVHEDNTPDAGYKIFYLKNIKVKYKNLIGTLPYYYFPGYMFRSDTGPIYSLKEFSGVRKWIKKNQYRFKKDSKSVSALWENLE